MSMTSSLWTSTATSSKAAWSRWTSALPIPRCTRHARMCRRWRMRIRRKRPTSADAHAPMSVAFGVAGVNILPVGNRGAIFAPKVPILGFDKQIDTPERGRMVVEALGEGCAVVLKNHGVVVTSDTIENVCITLFALEETAQLHWRAAQLGTVEPISGAEVKRVMTGARYEEYFSHVWGHYEALDPWNKK